MNFDSSIFRTRSRHTQKKNGWEIYSISVERNVYGWLDDSFWSWYTNSGEIHRQGTSRLTGKADNRNLYHQNESGNVTLGKT